MTPMFKRFIAATALSAALALPVSAQTEAHGEGDGHDHAAHAEAQKEAAAKMEEYRKNLKVSHVFSEAPDEHVLGATDAPVTVIAYASVMCPHCASWFDSEWPTFKKDYVDTGKVRFVFREFLTAPQELAVAQFSLANCAPEDKYFDNLTYQMKEQADIIKSAQAGTYRDTFLEIAANAGLANEDAAKACLSDETNFARIRLASDRAVKGEINSVPNFIIDGEIFKKPGSVANLAEAIEVRLSSGVSKP